MKAGTEITRREFIETTTATAAVGFTAAGSAGAASERVLNFALIGCGGRGRSLLREVVKRGEEKGDVKVTALCDIYDKRKKQAEQIAKGATIYHEYEELLKHKDLDCVVIAPPDHWHAQMAIEALEKGKDIYLEKPMTHTIQEARELWKTVERTKRILQVGSQGMSSDRYWQARRLIEKGLIGKVVWSQSSYSRNSVGGEWNYPIDEGAEKQIDWQRFLGKAPKRPYDPERFFRWRKYWDYSGGIATDLFYHRLSPMVFMTGSEFPTRVCAAGGIYVHADREVPDTFLMTVEYPNQHTILLASSMANANGLPEMVRGHHATITFENDNVVIRPENEYKEKFARDLSGEKLEVQNLIITSQKRETHMDNFITCVRTREKPHYDVRLGYLVQVAITLGVKAYRENKVMEFNPETDN